MEDDENDEGESLSEISSSSDEDDCHVQPAGENRNAQAEKTMVQSDEISPGDLINEASEKSRSENAHVDDIPIVSADTLLQSTSGVPQNNDKLTSPKKDKIKCNDNLVGGINSVERDSDSDSAKPLVPTIQNEEKVDEPLEEDPILRMIELNTESDKQDNELDDENVVVEDLSPEERRRHMLARIKKSQARQALNTFGTSQQSFSHSPVCTSNHTKGGNEVEILPNEVFERSEENGNDQQQTIESGENDNGDFEDEEVFHFFDDEDSNPCDKDNFTLNLSNSKIEVISDSHFEVLSASTVQRLILQGNDIQGFHALNEVYNSDSRSKFQLSSLVELDLAENKLTGFVSVNGEFCTSLKVLKLQHNSITSLCGVHVLQNLEVLDIAHNEVKAITHLEHLRKLKQLNASQNRLSSFLSIRSLSINQDLVKLNLKGNPFVNQSEHPSRVEALIRGLLPRLDELNDRKIARPVSSKQIFWSPRALNVLSPRARVFSNAKFIGAYEGNMLRRTVSVGPGIDTSSQSTEKLLVSKKEQSLSDKKRSQPLTRYMYKKQSAECGGKELEEVVEKKRKKRTDAKKAKEQQKYFDELSKPQPRSTYSAKEKEKEKALENSNIRRAPPRGNALKIPPSNIRMEDRRNPQHGEPSKSQTKNENQVYDIPQNLNSVQAQVGEMFQSQKTPLPQRTMSVHREIDQHISLDNPPHGKILKHKRVKFEEVASFEARGPKKKVGKMPLGKSPRKSTATTPCSNLDLYTFLERINGQVQSSVFRGLCEGMEGCLRSCKQGVLPKRELLDIFDIVGYKISRREQSCLFVVFQSKKISNQIDYVQLCNSLRVLESLQNESRSSDQKSNNHDVAMAPPDNLSSSSPPTLASLSLEDLSELPIHATNHCSASRDLRIPPPMVLASPSPKNVDIFQTAGVNEWVQLTHTLSGVVYLNIPSFHEAKQLEGVESFSAYLGAVKEIVSRTFCRLSCDGTFLYLQVVEEFVEDEHSETPMAFIHHPICLINDVLYGLRSQASSTQSESLKKYNLKSHEVFRNEERVCAIHILGYSNEAMSHSNLRTSSPQLGTHDALHAYVQHSLSELKTVAQIALINVPRSFFEIARKSRFLSITVIEQEEKTHVACEKSSAVKTEDLDFG